jgi:hypothetical protein
LLCCNSVIGEAVEIAGKGILRSKVPLTDTMPLVRKTTISSDTRTVMANKTVVINLRKNLRPNDSRNSVKDNILSLNLRGHTAEFTFYGHKVRCCFRLTAWSTAYLQFLKEPKKLPETSYGFRARMW